MKSRTAKNVPKRLSKRKTIVANKKEKIQGIFIIDKNYNLVLKKKTKDKIVNFFFLIIYIKGSKYDVRNSKSCF